MTTATSEGWRFPGYHECDWLRMGTIMPPETLECVRHRFQFDPSYVVSISFPNTGSTWINEILFQLMYDCDPVLTKDTPDAGKWTYIELNFPKIGSSVASLETKPPPRLIASHLPARFFRTNHPRGRPKVILMLRNPKDTLVSMYHLYRMNTALGNFEGTWDEFFQLHKNAQLIYEDFFKYYSGWMKYKDHPNVLFVKYEDLHKDHSGVIKKVGAHIGKKLTPEQIQSMVNLSAFSHMGSDDYNRNRTENLREDISIFRKGRVGDWQNYFNESILIPLGLTFDLK